MIVGLTGPLSGGVIVGEVVYADHEGEDLRKEVEATAEEEEQEESGERVAHELHEGLENAVDGARAHRQRVQPVPPHVVPEFLHQRPFRPQRRRLLSATVPS